MTKSCLTDVADGSGSKFQSWKSVKAECRLVARLVLVIYKELDANQVAVSHHQTKAHDELPYVRYFLVFLMDSTITLDSAQDL
ncbi:hypothetical protein Tdes44962_MAKER04778 [Teratosphaeria destructans]|uniref:Uncharacterized protein n=1 Tax=Teratosphaeria destructans TaxID=418781 RepID=A0A9W7SLM9_9PEZI|nr:hypothetical protein Tdes44962_MAKER04778 [Teratosphaeria destructans]